MASDTTKTIKKVEKKGADKKNAKPKKDKKKGKGGFAAIGRYFKDVAGELKRVTWPTRKELISATGAVIVFVLVMALLVGVLDKGFYYGMFRPLTSIGSSRQQADPVVVPPAATGSDVSVVPQEGTEETQPELPEVSAGANPVGDQSQIQPEVVTGTDSETE